MVPRCRATPTPAVPTSRVSRAEPPRPRSTHSPRARPRTPSAECNRDREPAVEREAEQADAGDAAVAVSVSGGAVPDDPVRLDGHHRVSVTEGQAGHRLEAGVHAVKDEVGGADGVVMAVSRVEIVRDLDVVFTTAIAHAQADDAAHAVHFG